MSEKEKKSISIDELPFKLRFAYAKAEINAQIKAPTGRVRGVSKTGKELAYKFYEMEDFLPLALNLLLKYRIVSMFRIERRTEKAVPEEVATLEIMDCLSDQHITYEMPTADVTSIPAAIQALGAKTSFLRRYCYINALDISMKDAVEERMNTPKPTKDASAQLKTLRSKYSDEYLRTICNTYGVESVNDLPKEAIEFYLSKK